MAVEDQPSLIIVPHAHRLRQPAQAGHRRRARLAARRGGDPAHQGGATAGRPDEPSSCPRRRSRTSASAASAARELRVGVADALRRLPRRRIPSRRRAASASTRGELPDGWDADVPRFDASGDGTIATRKASRDGDPVGGRAGARSWSAARPTSRRSTLTLIDDGGDVETGAYGGPQPPLRHPRARHGRDRQRARRCTASARSARRSSSSPTTCAARSGSRR